VIVGARSAVFAPVPRLGLVVVDEEHDSSYKQDQLPRYHARDVAIKRAQLEGCPVILGSATPSLESWQNAQPAEGRPARAKLHELTERVSTAGPARLPIVKIVDMARERAALRSGPAGGRARDLLIGPTMGSHLRATLREGGQAILLLNRRGFAGHLGCASGACGWVQHCDQCSVAMVLHHRSLHAGTREHIRCHHCLTEQIVPARCPECSGRVLLLRPGTQRLEDELAESFGAELGPDAGSALLRVDSDTMRSAPDYFEAFAKFSSGAVRVLIGTQMLAKGLDFPNVRMVGIVDADTGLGLADFRASERTFQLISQVSGRAGRGEKPGVVVVQTLSPQHPAIVLAASHDYVGFAREELALRQAAMLPPARRMAWIVVRDEEQSKARERADELHEALRAAADPSVTLDPVVACPIERVAGQWRFGLALYAPGPGALRAALLAAAARGLLKSDAHTAIDVDPVSIL
jgi:primosomal protein N' (replication factor Y)